MAENLGDAVLELRTDDKNLTAGIDKARGGAERLGAVFDRVSRRASRMAAQISAAGAAGGAALALLARRSIAAADNIAKTADRIGLSTTALQELRYAADRTGTELQIFQQGLTAMVRRAGEAIRGNKAFADAFKAVGLSAEELRRLEPEEILRRVADGLAQIENAQVRIAVSDQIFSEAGRRMINTLNLGSAGLDEMAQKAHALGVVIDESMIRRAERANDELSDMGEVLRVAGFNIGLEFMPVVSELAKVMTDPAFIEGTRTVAQNMRDFVRWSTENADTVLRVVGALTGLMLGGRLGPKGAIVGLLLGGFSPEIVELLENLGLLDTEVEALAEDLRRVESTARGAGEGLGAASEEAASFLDKVREATADARFEAELMEANFSAAQEALARFARDSGLVESLKDITLATDEMKQAMADYLDEMERLEILRDAQVVIEETRTAEERLAIELERLGELLKAGAIDWETYERAVELAKDRMKDSAEETGDAFEDLHGQMEDALVQLGESLLKGEVDWKSFGKVALDVLQDIVEQWLEAQDILKTGSGDGFGGIFGAIGNIFGSIFGGGGGGGINSGGTGNSPLQIGFADGGRPPVGRPSVVGERGPELFVPDAGGTIIPNHLLGNLGGSPAVATPAAAAAGGNTFFLDLRGTAGSDEIERKVREGIQKATPRIVGTSVKAVRERNYRDPSFRRPGGG